MLPPIPSTWADMFATVDIFDLRRTVLCRPGSELIGLTQPDHCCDERGAAAALLVPLSTAQE